MALNYTFCTFTALQVFVLLLVATPNVADRCLSYCTSSNQFRSSFSCYGSLFCCGSARNKFCCSSELNRIQDEDNRASTNTCTHLTWWAERWRLIFGIGFTLAGLAVVFTVCRFCCLKYKRRQRSIQPNDGTPRREYDQRSAVLHPHSARMAHPPEPPPYCAMQDKPPAYNSVYQSTDDPQAMNPRDRQLNETRSPAEGLQPPPAYSPH